MTVMILERVPTSLRGDLSRWMIEPRAGTFLGKVSARVRDRLWERAVKHAKHGACFQAWSSPKAEQGFVYRVEGDPSRRMLDMEGIHLVLRPKVDSPEDRLALRQEG
ncbi:type I-E CRISPR-associated endoribonuclease Cas2e [Stratiformator vulcanicus]|uniref:type I-E CRISPR-associated endoribonuclease Cas2e n=1 Tax=Stratiformator vulcanicus TaxID=2527980 RepID=UPI0011AA130B